MKWSMLLTTIAFLKEADLGGTRDRTITYLSVSFNLIYVESCSLY